MWNYPATIKEVRLLFERGLARVGQKAAVAPYEFAVSALTAGVDAGIPGFCRFVIRTTTSTNTKEAIPNGNISIRGKDNKDNLIPSILEWIKRLPKDNVNDKKFRGFVGPIEDCIIRIAKSPEDYEIWQELIFRLTESQRRIDNNIQFREHAKAVPLLKKEWFNRAWPKPSYEVLVAKSIASVGAVSTTKKSWPH